MSKETEILIIGSGTFGISTAFHLAKRGYTNVTCIDKHPYPSLDSAGYDINKIIRTEYDEPLYSSLAFEALEAWREPFWDNIFHETGWLVTSCGSPAAVAQIKESYDNLVKQGHAEGIEWVEKPGELIKHVPQLKHAKDLRKWSGLWNRQAGWVHAKNALEKLGTEAERLGVKFISGADGTMTQIIRTSEGKITGIEVASGAVRTAQKYILATGAASPALLPELAKTCWSKCWTLAHIQLTPEEAAEYKNMPVVDNHELGFFFEPDENGLIKICNNFKGYEWKNDCGVSVPRYASEHPEDGIPEEAIIAIQEFISNLTPQFSGRELIGARICWCTDTPNMHWLITPHPDFKGGELLLATGDSGHGFKFLPTIGKYIADALEGDFRKEWGWRDMKFRDDTDRARPGDGVKDLRDVGIGVDGKYNKL